MTDNQLNTMERLKAIPMTREQFDERIRYDKMCYQNTIRSYYQRYHKDPTDDDTEASAEPIDRQSYFNISRRIVKQPLYTCVVVDMMSYDNTMTHFLLNIGIDIMAVEALILQYYIGSTRQGKTVCWRFLNDGRYNANEDVIGVKGGGSKIIERPTLGTPVNANIITFNELTGFVEEHHRIYQDDPFLSDENFGVAFFGGHLLCEGKHKGKTVAVVQEELSAALGALAYPNFLWLAVGCSQNLTDRHLQLLSDRSVVLYPDNTGAVEFWSVRASRYTNVEMSKIFTDRDINEYLINKLKKGK